MPALFFAIALPLPKVIIPSFLQRHNLRDAPRHRQQYYPQPSNGLTQSHHELINWYRLAGAMAELNRKPDYTVFQESWITNSDKVLAVFRP
jgi:hypothetical protein